MAKGDIYKVSAPSGLWVRTDPDYKGSNIFAMTYGTTVTEIEVKGDWMYHDKGGWSHTDWLKLYMAAPEPEIVTTNPTSPGTNPNPEDSGYNSDGSIYNPDIEDIYDTYISNTLEDVVTNQETYTDLESVVGVFGLPYQFLPDTDSRIPGSKASNARDIYSYRNSGIGNEFADRIVAKMPILFMAPGRPSFMTKYSREEKEKILGWSIERYSNIENGTLEDLIESDGRYYTFAHSIDEYYKYVNPMCRIAARYLELQDFQLGGVLGNWRLDMVDWSQYTIGTTVGAGNLTTFTHIPFYLDSDVSVSDSFNNGTTQSTLASTVNGISDLGRELQFLTGYTSRALDSDWLQENADVSMHLQNIQDTVEGLLGSKNFISNLSRHLTSVASGGRLIFPEIWNESNFSRSYNVKVKLVAPDCTKLSVFLNVLVPLFHLIGFVAPQSMSDNPNGFTSPFLVRGIYKSFFNVDMGIITSMNITRGGNCMWTVDGLPTSIEVDFTIKDLYDVMAITPSSAKNWRYDTLSNTAQMDYIANLCGINMYKPEIGRMISMWLVNGANKSVDIPRNIWRSINESIGSGISGILRGIS